MADKDNTKPPKPINKNVLSTVRTIFKLSDEQVTSLERRITQPPEASIPLEMLPERDRNAFDAYEAAVKPREKAPSRTSAALRKIYGATPPTEGPAGTSEVNKGPEKSTTKEL